MKFYEKVTVTHVPLNEEIAEGQAYNPEAHTSLIEMQEFMHGLGFDLKDMVYMWANLLTMSGYSQKEIAEAMGVGYKTYRNRLWAIRGVFKDKGIREL